MSKMKGRALAIGEEAKLSAAHLKSTQTHGDSAHRKGVVKEIVGDGPSAVAKVEWKSAPGELQSVLASNLRSVATIHLELG